jgi:hypothetical protein
MVTASGSLPSPGDDDPFFGLDPEGRVADIGDGDLAGARGDWAKGGVAHPWHPLDKGIAVAGVCGAGHGGRRGKE